MVRLLKQIISILIVILLCLSFSETAFSVSNQTGIVLVDILNMRQTPTLTSKILSKLSKGMQVSITDKKDDWFKVDVNGLKGWVSSRYVSISVKKAQKGMINSSIVNLRSAAGMSASIIGKLPKGEMVCIVQTKGDWYEVKRDNGDSGWVRMDCITIDMGNTSRGMNDTAAKDTVKEREIDSPHFAEKGTDASVDNENDKSIQGSSDDTVNGMSNSINSPDAGSSTTDEKTNTGSITASSTSMGSITASSTSMSSMTASSTSMSSMTASSTSMSSITASSTSMGSITASSTSMGSITASSTSMSSMTASPNAVPLNADEIINFAKSLLGTPYIYGGASPGGFDCSGFTSYVYGKFGIQLERISSDQAKQGDEVAKVDLKPGNLVFFDTNGSHTIINHVGIYIGDGKFIHASSGTSTHCVIISDITTGYYADNFMTARCIYHFEQSNTGSSGNS